MEQGEISGSAKHDEAADSSGGDPLSPPMTVVKITDSLIFNITDRLGAGGFGVVWKGVRSPSTSTGVLNEVAVKFEKTDTASSKSGKEWEAYKALHGIDGVPCMHYNVTQGKYHIMIIDLLDKSLKDVLTKTPEKVTDEFVKHIAIQAISILEAVHSRGYLHGDIKPGNLLLDCKDKVFLTDFGLASRWKDDQDIRVNYGHSSFEGTVDYASVHTLLRRTRNRRDDLESLAYTLIRLIRLPRRLPWQEEEGENKNLHPQKKEDKDHPQKKEDKDLKYFLVCEKKMSTSPEGELCCSLPPALREFYKYVIELTFDEDPDYRGCILLFNGTGRPNRSITLQPMQVRTGKPATRWISVYDARQPMMQRYHYGVKSENVDIFINKGKEEKLLISSVASQNNHWALILDAGTGFSDQIKHSCDFFDSVCKEWIKEQWDKHYMITAVAGADDGSSLIVMSTGSQYRKQELKLGDVFPLYWVKKQWEDGLCITSMATAGNKWAIVMSDIDSKLKQEVELDFAYPYEGIHKWWEQGFMITATAATPKQVALVFSKPLDPKDERGQQNTSWYRRQDTYRTSDFPSTYIKEKWNKGRYVTSLCYGRTIS